MILKNFKEKRKRHISQLFAKSSLAKYKYINVRFWLRKPDNFSSNEISILICFIDSLRDARYRNYDEKVSSKQSENNQGILIQGVYFKNFELFVQISRQNLTKEVHGETIRSVTCVCSWRNRQFCNAYIYIRDI